jgi:hypothetical protein
MCDKNRHKSTEIRDGLKPIFDRNDVDPILRLLIHRALANHPITIAIIEGMNPIIYFKPYYDLIVEQEDIGWHQLYTWEDTVCIGTDVNEDFSKTNATNAS